MISLGLAASSLWQEDMLPVRTIFTYFSIVSQGFVAAVIHEIGSKSRGSPEYVPTPFFVAFVHTSREPADTRGSSGFPEFLGT